MTRTQIQLPEPLFRRLKTIARARDWSLAELVRRATEVYAQTCPEAADTPGAWELPVLRGSGGHRTDPAGVNPEADAVEERSRPLRHAHR